MTREEGELIKTINSYLKKYQTAAISYLAEYKKEEIAVGLAIALATAGIFGLLPALKA
jgi:uncharacterized protein YpmS